MYLMLKPVGSACNLGCSYCYYLDKGSAATMDEKMLENVVRQYIESQTAPEVLFTWHGGEPLLKPLAFYLKALELQRKYAGGRRIDNCLQTNGTLLTPEWCEFLRDNNFLVGISIDGPQPLHDAYRRSGAGRPTWNVVMRAIRLLQHHRVEWNAMATVNAENVGHPKAFYHFFRDMGCEFLQFTPVVEPDMPDFSITAEQWGDFLCSLYDEWVKEDVGRIFVQLFDATLANWAGVASGVCSMSASCGSAPVIEADGSVYCCDHFVGPAFRLGNIHETPLSEMFYADKQRKFGHSKSSSLPRECRECRWLFACHGECPKNRLANDRHGEAGLNVLCGGYRKFFAHVASDMDFMKAELDAGRPPSNICKFKKGWPY